MFKDRNQFNHFVKDAKPAIVEQVLRETIADACVNGGNRLRALIDSYQVFLRSGDFNMNMRDFEKQLSEFLVPSFSKNLLVYEQTRLASTDMEKPADAIENFNILQHVREVHGQEPTSTIIQDGIKRAFSWLN